MFGYYDEHLSAERLDRAYEIAPPRARRYLEAEIEHVLSRVGPGDVVLELGCGSGRVLERLAPAARWVCGIDTSRASLARARAKLSRWPACSLAAMDAARLGFREGAFDVTLCVQNGISAFHVDRRDLMREAIRVTRSGGTVLFSSYSDSFWPDRLAWFEAQAAEGLIGEIDRERTGGGTIVCRDGFAATTVSAREFEALARDLGVSARIVEVDSSSLFCEIAAGSGRSRAGGASA